MTQKSNTELKYALKIYAINHFLKILQVLQISTRNRIGNASCVETNTLMNSNHFNWDIVHYKKSVIHLKKNIKTTYYTKCSKNFHANIINLLTF